MILGLTSLAWGAGPDLEAVPPAAAEVPVVEIHETPVPDDGSTVSAEDVGSAVDLGDVLATTPGLVTRRLGGPGSAAWVSVRGAPARATLVRLDGIALNPDGGSAADLADLPLAGLGAVQIRRGLVADGALGAPMGGVVDVSTLDLARGAYALTARAGGPAYGEVSAVGAIGRGPVDVLVGGAGFATTGRFLAYDDRGTRFNDDDDAWVLRQPAAITQATGLLRGRWAGARTSVTVLNHVLGRQEQIPGPLGAPSVDVSQSTWRELVGVTVEGDRGPWSGDAGAWWLARGERTDDPSAELGIGAAWQRDAYQHGGAQARGGHRWRLASLEVTTSARAESYRRDTPTGVALTAARAVIGASVAADVHTRDRRFSVLPVLEIRALPKATAVDVAATPWLPRLTVVGRLSRSWTLRVAAGRTFRPPDLSERYGVRGQSRGNPDLRPESAWQGEAALTWSHVGAVDARWTATAFLARREDAIVWIQNAQRQLVPTNLGDARVAGVEAEATIATQALRVRLAAGWTDARNLSEDAALRGAVLPGVPQALLDAVAEVRLSPHANVGALCSHQSGTFRDAGNTSPVPARTTLDAWLRVQTETGLQLTAGARNLLNQRTVTVPRDPQRPDAGVTTTAWTDLAGWPLPGLQPFVEVEWRPTPRARP
ncbi:MAG: hypothetical protein RLZZ383_1842 [Pseudomonadota bacterium]